jgi:hypothetical protein
MNRRARGRQRMSSLMRTSLCEKSVSMWYDWGCEEALYFDPPKRVRDFDFSMFGVWRWSFLVL